MIGVEFGSIPRLGDGNGTLIRPPLGNAPGQAYEETDQDRVDGHRRALLRHSTDGSICTWAGPPTGRPFIDSAGGSAVACRHKDFDDYRCPVRRGH